MAENEMTHSQKILVKILLYALVTFLVSGLIGVMFMVMEMNQFLYVISFWISGISGTIVVFTFMSKQKLKLQKNQKICIFA